MQRPFTRAAVRFGLSLCGAVFAAACTSEPAAGEQGNEPSPLPSAPVSLNPAQGSSTAPTSVAPPSATPPMGTSTATPSDPTAPRDTASGNTAEAEQSEPTQPANVSTSVAGVPDHPSSPVNPTAEAMPTASGGGAPTPLDHDAGAGQGGSAGTPAAPSEHERVPPTVFIAGDSTVATYSDTAAEGELAGWGQMLHEYFDERVVIENRAVGGRTARRFIDEGLLDEIDAELGVGDALLVQFGTNDGHSSAIYELDGEQIPYYLDPATDFKAYLTRYIEVARAHDATLVFVTPPPRNSAYCTGGNGTGAHAAAMRELAEEQGVALSDLNRMTVDHLEAICPAPTLEDFFFVRDDGSIDGTHFQENGARIMAGFVASGIAASRAMDVATWLRPTEEGR